MAWRFTKLQYVVQYQYKNDEAELAFPKKKKDGEKERKERKKQFKNK